MKAWAMCSCKVDLFRTVRILRENQELSNDTAHKYKSKTNLGGKCNLRDAVQFIDLELIKADLELLQWEKYLKVKPVQHF